MEVAPRYKLLAYTVDMVYTFDMVYPVGMVCSVDMVSLLLSPLDLWNL